MWALLLFAVIRDHVIIWENLAKFISFFLLSGDHVIVCGNTNKLYLFFVMVRSFKTTLFHVRFSPVSIFICSCYSDEVIAGHSCHLLKLTYYIHF